MSPAVRGSGAITLALGTLALTVATVALLALPAFADPIRDEFGLSNAEVGVLTSVFAATYVGVQIPAGVLGGVFGVGKVLAASFALMGIGFVCAAVADSYAMLLVSRALAGIGAGPLMPLGSAIVTSPDPARNARRQGIMAAGWGLGYVLGLTGLPLLFETWPAAFVATGSAGLVLAVLTLVLAPDAPVARRATIREAAGGLGRSATWLLGGFMFGIALVNSGVGAWAVVLGRDALDLSDGAAATLSSLIGWALIPSSLAAALLAQRTSERFVMLITCGALVAAILLLAAPLGAVGVAAAFLIVGWCSGASLGVALGLVQRVVPTPGPRAQGAVVGGLNVVAFSANIVAPPAVGFAGEQLTSEFRRGFLVLLIGPVVAAAAGLRALHRAGPRR